MSNASWHVSENGLTHDVPGSAEATTHDHGRTAPAQVTSARETLETRLLREGYVTADQLSELVRYHVQTQRPIEELVQELGLVPRAVLEQMLHEAVVPPALSTVDSATFPGHAPSETFAEADPAPAELRVLPAWESVSEPHVAVAPEPVDITPAVVADVLPLDASATPSSLQLPVEQPPATETGEEMVAQPSPESERTETALHVSAPEELEPEHATRARVVFDVVVLARAGRELTATTRSSRAAAQDDVARLGHALNEGGGAWLETENWMIRRGAVVAVGVRTRLAAD